MKVDLAFALLAFAISFSSLFEIWTFKTNTLTEYVPLFKTTIVFQGILWVSFAWFVYFYTQSVRFRIPVLISVLYALAVTINLISPSGLLFAEITELTSHTMATGEVIYLGQGPANTFRFIADFAWLMLMIYTAYACINFGRKGNAKKAWIFATTIFLCIGLGYVHGTLIDFGVTDPPYLGSFLFLPLAMMMSLSLVGDVSKASGLSNEIRVAEMRWRNLLENVQLVVLGITRDKTVSYVNPYFLQLTGYRECDILNSSFVELLPEKQREIMDNRLNEIMANLSSLNNEHSLPILTKSNGQRVIIWSDVLLTNSDNLIEGTLSIGKDITDQVHAEAARDQAIQELTILKETLEEENISLKEIIQSNNGFEEIVGESNGLLYVLSKVQQVASTDSTVLILGETGTGKESIARAVYQESQRSHKPFVRVNCAAIPANLVESELFGHEPGSFTNAMRLHRGKFEIADGGTIFLDEISELPLEAQAKLLHILQERELERVGGSQAIPVDVRIISATNRDLSIEVAEGRFRSDLYYRLNVYPVTIPPLRKRKEDIPLLVKHFVSLFNKQFGKRIDEVPTSILDTLQKYDWPGNIRELKNIIERTMITCSGSSLALPDEFRTMQKDSDTFTSSLNENTKLLSLVEVERQHILRALKITNWRIGGINGASKILKINSSTLRSRIKKHGLEKP